MSRKDTKPLVIGCYLGLVGIVYITGIYSRDKYYFQITYIYLYSFSILKYIMQMFYTFWFWYKHSHFFPISFTMAPDSIVLSSVLSFFFFLMHMKALVLKPKETCIYCKRAVFFKSSMLPSLFSQYSITEMHIVIFSCDKDNWTRVLFYDTRTLLKDKDFIFCLQILGSCSSKSIFQPHKILSINSKGFVTTDGL